MDITDNIIWQLKNIYQPGLDFAILLDPVFAEKTFNYRLSQDKWKRMQELPKELMNFKNPEPYRFHPENLFLRQINISAGDGKWLSLDSPLGGAKPLFDKPIKYSTHNFDIATTSDVLTTMALFEIWVEYSKYLME